MGSVKTVEKLGVRLIRGEEEKLQCISSKRHKFPIGPLRHSPKPYQFGIVCTPMSQTVVKSVRLRQEIQDLVGRYENHVNHRSPLPAKEAAKLPSLFHEYEVFPTLLDDHLENYITRLSQLLLQCKRNKITFSAQLARALSVLGQVRGDAYCSQYFSSDVYLLDELLAHVENPGSEDEAQVFLLWLSHLALAPFPLATVRSTLSHDIVEAALSHLAAHSSASRRQKSAARLMSNLLTRNDQRLLLEEYLNSLFSSWVRDPENTRLGALMVINKVLAGDLGLQRLSLALQVHAEIVNYEISVLKHGGSSANLINVKYLVKVCAKIGAIYCSEQKYDGVAEIIDTLVNSIMASQSNNADSGLRETTAKNVARLTALVGKYATNYAFQITQFMVRQLRIPALETDNFQTGTIDSANLLVSRCHVVLLYLGFLHLFHAADKTWRLKTLFISRHFMTLNDVQSARTSQLRDAATFCAWAVVREYNSSDHIGPDSEALGLLFADLIRVIVFDSDFTVRRCAIAVLQEFVGRIGLSFLVEGHNFLPRDAGEWSVRFIEDLSVQQVSSLEASHEFIHRLVAIGFPKAVFMGRLMDEILGSGYLFSLRKLASSHFCRLEMLTEEAKIKICTELCNIAGFTDELLLKLSTDPHCILPLSELMHCGLLSSERQRTFSQIMDAFVIDRHHHTVGIGEAYLHSIKGNFRPEHFDNVMAISRMKHTPELELALSDVLRGVKLEANQLHQIFRFLELGNVLLAQPASLLVLSDAQLEAFLLIALDAKVDIETRKAIVGSFEKHLSFLSQRPDQFCALLDDYTLSTQGDVGLKVRIEALQLISRNPSLYFSLGELLVNRLVRLSGEAMDKIRRLAFELLCRALDNSAYAEHYDRYMSDYLLYFADYIALYKAENLDSVAFWSGIAQSAGATTGSSQLVNASFRAVLRLMRQEPEQTLKTLFLLLKTPPKLSQREQKIVHCVLKVIGQIMDAGIVPIPFNYEPLFVRAYNLQLGVKNITRYDLTIRVLQHLGSTEYLDKDIHLKARARLCFLATKHADARIRQIACDGIFEIVNELDPENDLIAEMNSWATKPPQHKKLEIVLRGLKRKW